MRTTSALIALAIAFVSSTAQAQDSGFRPITDEAAFVSQVAQKNLRLPLFKVELRVQADGSILGNAMGKPVTGSWQWKDGTFCREMQWGNETIAHNCQLVEVAEGKVRFTLNGGNGDSATFKIR